MSNHSTRPLSELTVEFGTRPRAPRFETATEDNRRRGRRLAAIHRMHLNDLGRIGILLDRIEAGAAEPAQLAQAIQSLEMAENVRNFGALCGRECKVLTFHHDAEEYSLFPQLEAQGNAELTALVRRLKEEHEIVHELLTRLERASMALMFDIDAERYGEVRDIFRQLERVVKSHFGYEETELEESIGLFIQDL